MSIILKAGQIGTDFINNIIKIGDGVHIWDELPNANIFDLSNYYDKYEIDEKLDDLTISGVDLSNYYDKTEIDNIVDNIDSLDLTNYYNKSEIYNKNEVDILIDNIDTSIENEINEAVTNLVDSTPDYINTLDGLSDAILNAGNVVDGLIISLGSKLTKSDIISFDNSITITPSTSGNSVDIKINEEILSNIVSNPGNVDLSDYYNKLEVDNLVNSGLAELVNSAPEYIETLNDLENAINSAGNVVDGIIESIATKANSSDLDNYYNKSQVDILINDIDIPDVDLTNYYNKIEIDEKFDNIDISDINLDNYYDKEDIDNLLATEIAELVNSTPDYITALNDLANEISSGNSVVDNLITSLGNRYTKSEVDNLLNNVNVDLSQYYNRSQVDSMLAIMQAKINTLESALEFSNVVVLP
jgi:hypothetical protein